MSKIETSCGNPRFTEDELKAIHRELFQIGWQGETFYKERKTVMRKLDALFGPDRGHLNLQTR